MAGRANAFVSLSHRPFEVIPAPVNRSIRNVTT
jgi:hypothetical protein